jgi:hypothetical protein
MGKMLIDAKTLKGRTRAKRGEMRRGVYVPQRETERDREIERERETERQRERETERDREWTFSRPLCN